MDPVAESKTPITRHGGGSNIPAKSVDRVHTSPGSQVTTNVNVNSQVCESVRIVGKCTRRTMAALRQLQRGSRHNALAPTAHPWKHTEY